MRATLRRRWRSWVALALLLGVGAGAGLGLMASARRTASAYPRFLDSADAPDVIVDYSPDVLNDR